MTRKRGPPKLKGPSGVGAQRPRCCSARPRNKKHTAFHLKAGQALVASESCRPPDPVHKVNDYSRAGCVWALTMQLPTGPIAHTKNYYKELFRQARLADP